MGWDINAAIETYMESVGNEADVPSNQSQHASFPSSTEHFPGRGTSLVQATESVEESHAILDNPLFPVIDDVTRNMLASIRTTGGTSLLQNISNDFAEYETEENNSGGAENSASQANQMPYYDEDGIRPPDSVKKQILIDSNGYGNRRRRIASDRSHEAFDTSRSLHYSNLASVESSDVKWMFPPPVNLICELPLHEVRKHI